MSHRPGLPKARSIYARQCVSVLINVSEIHYCQIHGEYRGQGCADCRRDREEAESHAAERFYEAQEEADRRTEDAAYEFANPGDYTCPFCRFKTLLMNASRCPKCHGVVSDSYWAEVEARNKAKAARAAERRAAEEARKAQEREEWNRKEPERRAAAAAQAAKEAAEASNRKRRKLGWGILSVFSIVVLSGVIYVATKPQPSTSAPQYSARVCEDSGNTTLDLSGLHVQTVVLQLRPGCFSGEVTLPGHWDTFGYRRAAGTTDGWVAWLGTSVNLWRLPPKQPGPLDSTATFSKANGGDRTVFRLQGSGTIVLYAAHCINYHKGSWGFPTSNFDCGPIDMTLRN